jgi:hypothetical protein
VLPVTAAGGVFTNTIALVKQPVGSVYVMIDSPLATPVTTPVIAATLTNDGVPDQLPPATELLSVTEVPGHILATPVIEGGLGLTVTKTTALQPVVSE